MQYESVAFQVFVLAFSALFCTRTLGSNALFFWCRFPSLKCGNPSECDYYWPYTSLTLDVLNDNEHHGLHIPNKQKFLSEERNKCNCMCKLMCVPVLDTQVLKWSFYFTPVGCSTRRCYPHTHTYTTSCASSLWVLDVNRWGKHAVVVYQ